MLNLVVAAVFLIATLLVAVLNARLNLADDADDAASPRSAYLSADVMPIVQYACFAMFLLFLLMDGGLAWWAVLTVVVVAMMLMQGVMALTMWQVSRSNTASAGKATLVLPMLRVLDRMFGRLMPRRMRNFKTLSLSTQPRVERADPNETMLKGILQFSAETVRDIMVSRVDIESVDIEMPFAELLEKVGQVAYSRMPVYQGSKDNIVGILYIKDLLPYLGRGDRFRWASLIRPNLCVPETKKIDNLLREFQARKIHIAVVIDEYGGVSGIVTLEDIIEEIVGEINDEYDDPTNPYVTLSDGVYVFDAKTSLQQFCKLFNLAPDFFGDLADEVDTLAGLMLIIAQELPSKHQTADFRQFRFEVLAVDERHISKLKVSVGQAVETPSETGSDAS